MICFGDVAMQKQTTSKVEKMQHLAVSIAKSINTYIPLCNHDRYNENVKVTHILSSISFSIKNLFCSGSYEFKLTKILQNIFVGFYARSIRQECTEKISY